MSREKIAAEIRDCLERHSKHAVSLAGLGKYRFHGWMSDGTTVIVEVREPTKASIEARRRHQAKISKGPCE